MMRIGYRGIPVVLTLSIALSSCCMCQAHKTPLEQTAAFDEGSLLMRDDLVVAIGRMKVAVAEYYNIYGKLPVRNRDAGLPEPDQYRGRTLRSASVGANGAIEFAFDARSGHDGGRVRLVPDTSHAAAMSIQWRCESADYPQIERVLPTCDYVSR
ncbi:MAG TPA: pilin [Xanthomonadaceae bacterium]|nr:pilin [Xanthomonadaceae bacterium]